MNKLHSGCIHADLGQSHPIQCTQVKGHGKHFFKMTTRRQHYTLVQHQTTVHETRCKQCINVQIATFMSPASFTIYGENAIQEVDNLVASDRVRNISACYLPLFCCLDLQSATRTWHWSKHNGIEASSLTGQKGEKCDYG